MNLDDIKQILDLVRDHNLAEFELERDGLIDGGGHGVRGALGFIAAVNGDGLVFHVSRESWYSWIRQRKPPRVTNPARSKRVGVGTVPQKGQSRTLIHYGLPALSPSWMTCEDSMMSA